jgi:hypothetical protein
LLLDTLVELSEPEVEIPMDRREFALKMAHILAKADFSQQVLTPVLNKEGFLSSNSSFSI